jgi:hypothetical protein
LKYAAGGHPAKLNDAAGTKQKWSMCLFPKTCLLTVVRVALSFARHAESCG